MQQKDHKAFYKHPRLFPNSYIITRKGNIIRDRSNIIKVEDYENEIDTNPHLDIKEINYYIENELEDDN